jgi:hypothetical protein
LLNWLDDAAITTPAMARATVNIMIVEYISDIPLRFIIIPRYGRFKALPNFIRKYSKNIT